MASCRTQPVADAPPALCIFMMRSACVAPADKVKQKIMKTFVSDTGNVSLHMKQKPQMPFCCSLA